MFLQGVIVLIGIVALGILIRLPLTEGRAVNLDLFHTYADPFIIYGYLASSAFFVGLYQAILLLQYIAQNNVFSPNSVRALRNIKYCAAALSLSIVMAGLYIKMFHAPEDDPAGFLALCFVMTFASIVTATAAAVFERVLQNAVDIKSEHDLTV